MSRPPSDRRRYTSLMASITVRPAATKSDAGSLFPVSDATTWTGCTRLVGVVAGGPVCGNSTGREIRRALSSPEGARGCGRRRIDGTSTLLLSAMVARCMPRKSIPSSKRVFSIRQCACLYGSPPSSLARGWFVCVKSSQIYQEWSERRMDHNLGIWSIHPLMPSK